MELDINRRREYLKNCAQVDNAMGQLPLILPDYMLVFAVAVLTHDPNFKKYDDINQLKQIESCLWFILEPLISNKEYFCFGFYKNLIDRMKLHKDAVNPIDDDTNMVRSFEIVQLNNLPLLIFLLFSNRKCGQYVTLQCILFIQNQQITIHEIFHLTLEYRKCIFNLKMMNLKIHDCIYQLICIRLQQIARKWELFYR